MMAIIIPLIPVLIPLITAFITWWLNKLNLDEKTKKGFLDQWKALQSRALKIVSSYKSMKSADRRAQDWYIKHQKKLRKEEHDRKVALASLPKPRMKHV